MNKYIMMFVAAIALVSCSDDVLETPSTPVEAGAEVKFGLSLESTRTIYGSEETTDDGKTVFPIYWVNGDKVQILSPDCLEKRDNAEYKVSVSSEIQPYADNLTITGPNGVQWGSKDKAIFYSIYPSGDYVFDEGKDQINGLKIGDSQTIKVNATNKTIGEADMANCLMYAVNDGGEDNNHLGVPKSDNPVDLQYNPISTVIYVTLKVAANEDATADNYTIQNVRLIAPAGTSISGSFSWDCGTNSVVADSFVGGSNVVVSEIVDGNNFHTLTNNESISFPIFIAPVSGLTVNKDWKIQVVVAGGATYTKSLDINKTLTPGQIHKIILPELKPSTTEWQVSNWMANIPRNVYLSEVSIPGSWNSLNKEFNTQGTDATTTIDNQYQKGIRAYHLDTRWQGEYSNWSWSATDVLGVANGGGSSDIGEGRVMTDSDNPTLSSCINAITENLKPEEYMVLICTFAQDSYNHYTADNKDWVGAISDACAGNLKVFDAKNLTENTVIGDVLNSLIVVVNLEGTVTSVPSDSKCLFVNMPLTLNSSTFTTNLTSAIYKGATNSTTAVTSGVNMYHTQAQVCISDSYDVPDGQSTENVDGRGYAPTFTARKNVANSILEDSKANHADLTNYKHNKWIYLGLGGYYMEYKRGSGLDFTRKWRAADNAHANVASDFNSWIDDKVTEMGTIPTGQTAKVPYYPVGIVLMNKVEDYASTVKEILMLNTKYLMQRDPNRPTTSGGYTLQQADYDGTLTNGGNAIQ